MLGHGQPQPCNHENIQTIDAKDKFAFKSFELFIPHKSTSLCISNSDHESMTAKLLKKSIENHCDPLSSIVCKSCIWWTKNSSSRASRQKKWIVDVASSTNCFYINQLFFTLRDYVFICTRNCFIRDKERSEQRRELNLVLKCNKTSELRLEIY